MEISISTRVTSGSHSLAGGSTFSKTGSTFHPSTSFARGAEISRERAGCGEIQGLVTQSLRRELHIND